MSLRKRLRTHRLRSTPLLPRPAPLPWHTTAHHAPGGFRNTYGTPPARDPLRAAGWMAAYAFRRKQPVPAPSVPLDAAALAPAPERLRLAWLGHSAVYAAFPGARVLIDPMFAERASPLPFAGPERLVAPPLPVEALPGVDIVAYSHDHYDHLDANTVRRLARRFDPLFVVPLGVGAFVRAAGAGRVVEVDWGERLDAGALAITCTPARHFSGRGLHNRNGTLWAGFHFDDGHAALYYPGDSGYGAHFGEAAGHLGAPDALLMPIGAYEPRWFMEEVHVSPDEAARAARETGARHVLPVHWGTFDLADEATDLPPRDFLRYAGAEGIADRVRTWAVGEVWELPARAGLSG